MHYLLHFLAHHALLSGKVERLNFNGILIKSAIFANCGSRRCPARKLNTKFVFPNNKDQLIFIQEPLVLLCSWWKLHFFSFFSLTVNTSERPGYARRRHDTKTITKTSQIWTHLHCIFVKKFLLIITRNSWRDHPIKY